MELLGCYTLPPHDHSRRRRGRRPAPHRRGRRPTPTAAAPDRGPTDATRLKEEDEGGAISGGGSCEWGWGRVARVTVGVSR
jgi:hypothetical protein